MKRVLVSVSETTGLEKFCEKLVKLGYEIIATDGTGRYLEKFGIKNIKISEVTGFPEILDGRVKTLHPKIYGGILSVRENENHLKEVKENNIDFIDMVVVNLYPFKDVLLKDEEEKVIIENIDIGGPSLIRASAKNFEYITVLVDPKDYDRVLVELEENEKTSRELRKELAGKAFRHTAAYDALIGSYFTKELFPENLNLSFEKVSELRYGENSHQRAAFYKEIKSGYSLAEAKQLHGKELSYNNIQDTNAVIDILKEFKEPTVVAVKHMNPCGVGSAEDIDEAWKKAYEADPISIFGGIVGVNRKVTEKMAEEMSKIFLEVIIAPEYEEKALEILTQKKNIRVMKMDMSKEIENKLKYVSVLDGILVQEHDEKEIEELNQVTKEGVSEKELEDLKFAWKVVKHVKSNAIVIAKDKKTIGIGAGQMNRVGSAKIALEQGKELCKGAVMASDAFFPMDDTVKEAAKYGIKSIIQPGGSIRDKDSIEACDENGIAMIFTKIRHFKH